MRKLNIEITLSGDYLQEVKFINALERDKIFFLIDGVALGEQQGNVRLQLKLETYLRSGVVPREAGDRKQDEDDCCGGTCWCFAIFMLCARCFTWRRGDTAPSGATTVATQGPLPSSTPAKDVSQRQTARQAAPLLAQTLDPTLRFDLLKSSEDVTYKGSGRDIFRSQAPPPEIPK